MEKEVKPCPFCGKAVDLNDEDTLYPSGTGWKDHPDGIRSYHSFREVPKEQWCYDLHCVSMWQKLTEPSRAINSKEVVCFKFLILRSLFWFFEFLSFALLS